ncbi:MAG: TetR family transcriptional regulator [Actinobacteria bacterium]|uniref:Unannotated protein n=1 Tax=freshwater metagenome TaxID=449393 RepID=A0A6J6Y059_9ZZZZ|nr:TetR family transcriptional regulator [Actinomycetota bacterium]MSX82259.1 TetR family transcriptional regulator [Actinomycetota bacterium]
MDEITLTEVAADEITVEKSLLSEITVDEISVDPSPEDEISKIETAKIETLKIETLKEETMTDKTLPVVIAGSSTEAAKPRKARVPASLAKERLIETTISLLRTEPFYEVTTRRITREAGLPLAALSRNFGSLPGLFDAVAHALVKSFTDQFSEYGPLDALTNPDLVLRTRLVAWSIGQGADPSIFRPDPSAWSRIGVERQQRLAGVDERMGTAWAEIVTFVLEGYAIFSQTHGLNNQQTFEDCITVMSELQKSLKTLEAQLGWDQPAS